MCDNGFLLLLFLITINSSIFSTGFHGFTGEWEVHTSFILHQMVNVEYISENEGVSKSSLCRQHFLYVIEI